VNARHIVLAFPKSPFAPRDVSFEGRDVPSSSPPGLVDSEARRTSSGARFAAGARTPAAERRGLIDNAARCGRRAGPSRLASTD